MIGILLPTAVGAKDDACREVDIGVRVTKCRGATKAEQTLEKRTIVVVGIIIMVPSSRLSKIQTHDVKRDETTSTSFVHVTDPTSQEPRNSR